jgi:hypothetical protein
MPVYLSGDTLEARPVPSPYCQRERHTQQTIPLGCSYTFNVVPGELAVIQLCIAIRSRVFCKRDLRYARGPVR